MRGRWGDRLKQVAFPGSSEQKDSVRGVCTPSPLDPRNRGPWLPGAPGETRPGAREQMTRKYEGWKIHEHKLDATIGLGGILLSLELAGRDE